MSKMTPAERQAARENRERAISELAHHGDETTHAAIARTVLDDLPHALGTIDVLEARVVRLEVALRQARARMDWAQDGWFNAEPLQPTDEKLMSEDLGAIDAVLADGGDALIPRERQITDELRAFVAAVMARVSHDPTHWACVDRLKDALDILDRLAPVKGPTDG